jgi:type IV pilus assembly protein PilA
MSFMQRNALAFRQNREEGFTLLEILVVITITGVLSAIAVPVFLNQRKNAVDDMLKTDLQNIIKVADSVRANNPNAQYIIIKDKKICAGATSAPTSCSDTSPVVVTQSGGTFVISGGKSGFTGGGYYASAWHPDANKYSTQNTRLLYASDEKKFKDCPSC